VTTWMHQSLGFATGPGILAVSLDSLCTQVDLHPRNSSSEGLGVEESKCQGKLKEEEKSESPREARAKRRKHKGLS
jgi:hypothetical protein